MKAILKFAAGMVLSGAMCFTAASAENITVTGVGVDGVRADAVDPAASVIEFYVTASLRESMLTKDNVSIKDTIGNELELLHISYDHDLSALSVVPKETPEQGRQYVLTVEKAVFDGDSDLVYNFAAEYTVPAPVSAGFSTENGKGVLSIEFEEKPMPEGKVQIVCTVFRGGKLINAAIKAVGRNETHIRAEIDGIIAGDMIRSYILCSDSDKTEILGNEIYEYTA